MISKQITKGDAQVEIASLKNFCLLTGRCKIEQKDSKEKSKTQNISEQQF